MIMVTRLSRLNKREELQVIRRFAILDDASKDDQERNRALADLGELFSRTDAFDPNECHAMDLKGD